MAAKKFQNLTIDAKTLRRFSVSDRLDFLRSSEGLNILPNFTPSDLNDLFPRYYMRVNKEFQAAMKAVSDRRNVNGGVSSSSASPVTSNQTQEGAPSSGTSGSTASPVGRQRAEGTRSGSSGSGTASTQSPPVTETWRARVRSRYGVDIDAVSGLNNSPLTGLIAGAESGRAGYNAYNRGTRGDRIIGPNGPVDLENMTIGELTRRQNLPHGHQDRIFAAGKYQVIPETMREAVQNLGLSPDQRFDRATQDRILRDYLLGNKRPAVDAYITGRSNNRDAAVNGLAREFASFQNTRGRGYYGRGNHASVTPERSLEALNHARETYRKAIESGKTPQEARRAAFGVMETQATGPIPQLPTGLDPKLVEEYNQMSPQQQRNFHTALGKLDTDPARAAEAMNGIYREAPAAAQRAAASGTAGAPATPSNPDAVPGLPTPPGAPSGATRQQQGESSQDESRITMSNQRAIRNQPLNPQLARQIQYAARETGVYVNVNSGGQDAHGHGNRRIGGRNHDHGHAADFELYRLDERGRRVIIKPDTEEGRATISRFIQAGARAGATNVGHGPNYMGGHRIHMGNSGPDGRLWSNAGRRGSTPALPWVRSAFESGQAERQNFNLDDYEKRRAEERAARQAQTSNTATGTNVQTTAPEPTSNATPSSPSSMPALRTEEKPVTQAPAQAQAPAQTQASAQPAPEAPAATTSNVKASEKESANTDIPVLATGGQIQTNSDELRAYPIDKHKSQRENMLVTDGTNKPLFAMNSEEELRYNPDSGKATVNPSPRGLKTDPSSLQQRLESPVEQTPPTQTPNSEQGVRPTPNQNQSPTININSPVMPAPNSFDSIRDGSLTRMSPSFERAVARSRFQNTGDQTLGGHFDWGAANIV